MISAGHPTAPTLTGNSWLDVLVIVGIVGAALAAIRTWLYKPLMEMRDQARERNMALFGIPADPIKGIPAVPGALQRIAVIEGEVTHNGGGSLKDSLRRVETTVEESRSRLTTLDNKVDLHIATSRDQVTELTSWRQHTDAALAIKDRLDAHNVQAATDDRSARDHS